HAQTYKIVTGGTDNHLFLVDLSDKNITGKDAEDILEKAHITLNKNAVPNDVRSPFVTSGIRIGTPALTTRGLKEKEVSQVATWICEVLNCLKGSADLEKEAKKQLIAELKASDVLNKIKIKAMALCNQFPVYS
ncbi:MAG: hypothetical protein REH83_05295, partial [Rickettsiella sp.]|nr:hypothetical protein [Rickettsiella sp.]